MLQFADATEVDWYVQAATPSVVHGLFGGGGGGRVDLKDFLSSYTLKQHVCCKCPRQPNVHSYTFHPTKNFLDGALNHYSILIYSSFHSVFHYPNITLNPEPFIEPLYPP